MTGFNSKRQSVWDKMVQELTMPDVEIVDQAQVDHKTWYTVKLSMPAGAWLREQPRDDWAALDRACYDVSEQMYSALMLKYGV